MAIGWDPRLETGNAQIDAQHRELIARIDRLLAAMQEGEGRKEIASVVAFLAAYVSEHFGTEEALMRTRRYPGLAVHVAEHRTLEDELVRLEADLEREGPGTLLVLRVHRHVLDWLRHHIEGSDRALAAWLAHAPPATTRP